MRFLTPRSVAAYGCVLAAWFVACCGFGTTAVTADSGARDASADHVGTRDIADVDAHDSGSPTVSCNYYAILPPILRVVSAVTGAPICDPVFIVVAPIDAAAPGNVGVSCAAAEGECVPTMVYDASDPDCTYALGVGGFGDSFANYTITVTAPGFATADVDHVSTGVLACGPGIPVYQAPSHLTVALTPLPAEAGADAQTHEAGAYPSDGPRG
jgi:hypothetical protein